jgi:hypothetical protein
MRIAEVPIQPPIQLNCPGSTDAKGDIARGVLGYAVKVAITRTGDAHVVSLNKACPFVYRGRVRGFYEALNFDLMRKTGHWRVTRRMNQVIT